MREIAQFRQKYQQIFSDTRWQAMEGVGAQTQRLLWASTGTKNPRYSDVLYVEELIGPDTVNTIPPSTLEAFRDHGRARASLEEDVEAANDTMEALEQTGISIAPVADDLLAQGIRLFAEAFDQLLNAVDRRCKVAVGAELNRQTYTLPENLCAQVQETIEDWRAGKVRRLWGRDASLWTGSDEARWLGWLGITEDQLAHGQHFTDIAEAVKTEGFTHGLLLGMGSSSLSPEMLRMTFGRIDGYPELRILDSTDPAQIRRLEEEIDLSRTLFIVSSKSGTTLEPNIFYQYFCERVKQVMGAQEVGPRFIAITDPGSKLEELAESSGFRRVFHGYASIGGRYSALSDFGMVPAAVMGIDAPRFLDRADEMAIACSSCPPVDQNPGVVLGIILGVLGREGRDKVTIISSPGICDLGAWLEQLLAESTGKEGKGLIPVDQEPLGRPEVYGDDRLFVYVRLETQPDASHDNAVDRLAEAGHPVVRIAVTDTYDLGQEIFRWEIATAVAGSVLGINPFNQPDVEASKTATRKLTSEFEEEGSLPVEHALYEDANIKLFSDEENTKALASRVGSTASLEAYLKAHFDRLGSGDYFALLAYVEMSTMHWNILQQLRRQVRDDKRVATCLGFGPRFLHSTGQAYKGGPNTGVFLQITADDRVDLAVPGHSYTFGVVKAAQARGDFQVLANSQRRALRVHLSVDVPAGLGALQEAAQRALQ